MRGVLVIMKDTAGLRNAAADVVEAEGIVRALAAYHKALLRILVLDASQVRGISGISGRNKKKLS